MDSQSKENDKMTIPAKPGAAVYTLTIEYPAAILTALQLPPEEFAAEARLLLAIKLHELNRLSTGLAARLAGVPRSEFFLVSSSSGVSPSGVDPGELEVDFNAALGASTPQGRTLVNQGDVYWAAPADHTEGESSVPHPYVIVQDDAINHSRIDTTVACALTSNLGRANETPGNVLLDPGEANLPRRSVVEVSKVTTIAKRQLGVYVGTLRAERVQQILAGMRFLQRTSFGQGR
jgi:mRNA interferase MazF